MDESALLVRFGERASVEQVEEGAELMPRFDADGLIPCVTTAASSGEVLMLGYMNAEALEQTIITGEAHYFSRSRKALWRKGSASGLVQKVVELRVDDDQDALWMKVNVAGSGASCHVGYRSCFFRKIDTSVTPVGLSFVEKSKVFRPEDVYAGIPNPTIL